MTVQETVVRCDLCLKDITDEEYIPRVKVKQKPKGGWSRNDDTNFWHNMDLCPECEAKIFEVIVSLRVKGSPVRIYKEKFEKRGMYELVKE